ncbi:Signal recognition particle 68 kDa protein [Metarhizium album ARSEF 1941]|uniref:Signal recognition particle subunit SRP68 n=1 Tax=Metarhizium album (strain ARSEF 1941) TaxID=1081103 RepID=A0A0B2WQ28_METAS|nr:Signal recognition particle 68 kDa protein [Metarhizium album ARSEF 1941]KHN98146.1 Signal recognition particle 68 kDa protein [Metarhizium album ARSEF 1941]
MDITSYVVQGRDQALLYGDYSTYHGQLAKRLLSSRKKLGIVTKNRGKFQSKEEIGAEQVSSNIHYVYLLLLTSERAWAQAMSFKASKSAAQKDITGRTKSHIVSRLNKASRTSQRLVELLSDSASGASANDILEAKSYAALIRGAMLFEKHDWELCLQSYAVSRVIYSALASAGKGDLFKDLLSETIDPSIRYAAYRLKTPRTTPIPTIAKNSFPRSDDALVKEINRLDPSILAEGNDATRLGNAAENAPTTITWRSRQVQIEDAQISLAWASVETAKATLTRNLTQSQDKQPYEIAAQYDEILMATQDVVDATKQAIDELKAEGVPQSDPRMQRLQITRTAVNYEMISWRIGRNRVLTGHDDGGPEDYNAFRRRKVKIPQDTEATKQRRQRELPPSKKLAKLKEKVALYDGTLQNVQSIKELPGVAADEALATRLNGYEKYFGALKCLSIARSHAITDAAANALALINHANSLIQEASCNLPRGDDDINQQQTAPLSIDVTANAVSFLSSLLNGELQRYRAIVHMHNLRNAEREAAEGDFDSPLISKLHIYPRRVNLRKIVEFPPKMELMPMKPIFLDVAWNYIEYPGKTRASTTAPGTSSAAKEEQPKKKGWFGFGR